MDWRTSAKCKECRNLVKDRWNNRKASSRKRAAGDEAPCVWSLSGLTTRSEGASPALFVNKSIAFHYAAQLNIMKHRAAAGWTLPRELRLIKRNQIGHRLVTTDQGQKASPPKKHLCNQWMAEWKCGGCSRARTVCTDSFALSP